MHCTQDAPLSLWGGLSKAISLPKGVFVSSDGRLEQVTLEAVGPDTQGVLVLSMDQATAYAKVAKPVSRKALGILVLGSAVVEGATVPYETLRFTATLICTQEPLLLPAVLYQIGSQSVAKFTPRSDLSEAQCRSNLLLWHLSPKHVDLVVWWMGSMDAP